MLQSGEDPRYIARRLVVVASEDVGLADNSMLSLATATYAACEKIGMPECGINLAHAVTALSLAPKSTRAYRGYRAAEAALKEPGVAALPVPLHLRNAPTKLLKEVGCGKGYKYNPDYVDGKVRQEYLPEGLRGRVFLGDKDLGSLVDEDLEAEEEDNSGLGERREDPERRGEEDPESSRRREEKPRRESDAGGENLGGGDGADDDVDGETYDVDDDDDDGTLQPELDF